MYMNTCVYDTYDMYDTTTKYLGVKIPVLFQTFQKQKLMLIIQPIFF